ncbi:GGDEF domain-containing protein [Saccharothrix coeruleofusca]|uniref:GGDEF domain-containing protein n=1 Tax=Saccharothrix coeruleofusca TaxID=33919 RepID=A0A918AQ96_9PSEU|nr:GGDEF domain-containing protein [Saccharothrix coeruleofusca]MBP2339140.1 GGDEF domain-containing protein [Saccharothrix coeruleofusca]GGP70228.1 hypothetical protein GCM10010185_49060 [Saccharothrix coeruleofusca]
MSAGGAAARRSVAEGPRSLKSRWRAATLAAGWAFPADWQSAAVDDVCRAVLGPVDPCPALAGLGAARAEAGVGLAETLLDLAALHAVLSEADAGEGGVAANVDSVPARMLRATALGWADVVLERASTTTAEDPLTGLATGSYLRTRLREVYAADTAGDHALVLVSLELSRASGWSRVVARTLLADALREAFDGGETVATLGPSVAAVLLRRDRGLAARVADLRALIGHRLAADPHVRPTGPARVRSVSLPATYEEAGQLLTRFSR